MVVNVIGIVIGILVLCGSLFYLVKEKDDPESRKIYLIAAVAGVVIVAVMLVRMFVL